MNSKAHVYKAVFNELSAELEVHPQALDELLSDDLPRLNRRLTGAGLPRIEFDPAK